MSSNTPKLDEARRRLARLNGRASVQANSILFDFDAKTGEIWLEGEFGQNRDGIDARSLRAALKQIGNSKPITLYINSPGGSVTEGFACYKLLEEHRGTVTTHVVGIAASMASLVAQAGGRRLIDRHAIMMVHLPWMPSGGNSDELRKQADILQKVETTMISVYARRTGLSKERVRQFLADETWFSADDAIANGFCDSFDLQAAATKAPQLSLAQAKLKFERTKSRFGISSHKVPMIARESRRFELARRLLPLNATAVI